MKKMLMLLVVVILPGLGLAGTLDADVRQAQSELKSMSHGFYTPESWARMEAYLDDLQRRAEMTERDDLILQLATSRALVLSQALQRNRDAVELLQSMLERFASVPDPALRRMYVLLAETYARMGDEASIAALIAQYRNSPLYDPEPFEYSGGSGPGDPIVVKRPRAGGAASLTVTAMENAARTALLAPGYPAPDFEGFDLQGRPIQLHAYRGTIVLLDFFHPDWPAWVNHLAEQEKVYREFSRKGFEIVGVPLVAGGKDGPVLPWPILQPSRAVMKAYWVVGEVRSFLIDPDGRVLARDPSPAELREILSERLRPEL